MPWSAISFPHDWTRKQALGAIALLVGAFAALLAFGAIGVFRHGPPRIDLWTLFHAGSRFLDEMLPYGRFYLPFWGQQENIATSYYAYPPHFSPAVMAMAALSFDSAQWASVAVNLFAAVMLAALVAAMMTAPAKGEPEAASFAQRRVMAATIILMSPFAAHVVWLGNTTIVVAASLCGAWLLASRGQPIAAGILFALATWKPQFALLPAVWFFLERRSRLLMSTAGAALILASWHIVKFGLLTSIVEWLHAVQTYSTSLNGSLGEHSFGVRELIFDAIGTRLRIEIAALPLTALLWWKRHLFNSLERLGLLAAVGILLLPAQDYDLIILAPLAGAVLARPVSTRFGLLVPALACGAMFIPYRLVAKLDMTALTQWRVVAVVIIAVWLVHDVLRTAQAVQASRLAARAAAVLRRPRHLAAAAASARAATTAQPSNPG